MDDRTSHPGLSLALVALLFLLLLGGGFVWLRRSAAVQAEMRAREAAAQQALLVKEREVVRLRQELAALRDAPMTLRSDAPAARAPVAEESAVRDVPPPPAVVTAAEVRANAWLQRLRPERYAALTPAALHAIAELDLRGCEITDADLALLAALPNLASLELRGTAVTDAGLPALAALPLRTLSLRGTQVGAPNLPMLPATLQHLDLTDTRGGTEACRFLRPLPDLHTLKLNRLPVDDAALDALPPLPRLRHLEIDGTQVTVAGVERLLQRYPLLSRIEVRGVSLVAETLAELGRRFPQVTVVTDSEAPERR